MDRDRALIYGAGLVQGTALVTFPAVSGILTSPTGYGLSSTQYGTLFIPQVVAAITGSLLGARWLARAGDGVVLRTGLGAGLAAMVLLLVSNLLTPGASGTFAVLLLATAALGTGFGLTVPTLNVVVAAIDPARANRAVLTLNALLGLGTVLAPVFVAVFVGLGYWWGLPLVAAALFTMLLVAGAGHDDRTVRAAGTVAAGEARAAIPSAFWLFAAAAVLYGLCETMNGNWSQVLLTGSLGASAAVASFALTAFWAMVTVGRVGFAAVERRVPPRITYVVLPVVLAAAFLVTAALPDGAAAFAMVAAFGLAGLGCSALLPLTISFGDHDLGAIYPPVAGGIVAAYQVGYGLAAFGVGPLVDSGASLTGLFAGTAAVALALTLVAVVITRHRTAEHTLNGRVSARPSP
jgi:fucose permease